MKKIFFLTISINVFIFSPNFILANGDDHMMNFGCCGFMNSWPWFGWIFMVLFWVLVILVFVSLIRWLTGQGKDQIKEKSALDILKKRYVKGEISKEEFEEKKKDLV